MPTPPPPEEPSTEEPTKFYVLDWNDEVAVETDEDRWFKWMFVNSERRAVAETSLGLTCSVSTAFIGLDEHPEGEPRPWQTVVLGGPREGLKKRYRTRAEALRGHEEVVREMHDVAADGRLNGRP